MAQEKTRRPSVNAQEGGSTAATPARIVAQTLKPAPRQLEGATRRRARNDPAELS